VIESRDHLFFRCSFSSWIWKNCLQRYNIGNPDLDWSSVLDAGVGSRKLRDCGVFFAN